MDLEALFRRYQELQGYSGWTAEDAARVQSVAGSIEPHLAPLVEDFYVEIDRHPAARKVITGGPEQINRLKRTLTTWLRELLAGPYDAGYVGRRWRVGWRHVDIGLDQVYTIVALSRLRTGLTQSVQDHWEGESAALTATLQSLNKLLDLDLAIIEDAYQAEYLARQQRTERLATIGHVGAGIAHELRNPLNVVKTSVYYLLNACSLTPAKTAEHLSRIEQQVNQADGVITALSSFARMPLPDLSPFSIEECLRELLETQPVPEHVDVTITWARVLPPVLGDRNQIRIVLGNLIRNACDAMPQGGRLAVNGRLRDDHVHVAVQDTGVGIPEENLSRIMEPLYSTKARGLGLGLSIARAILDKNRGSLHVESKVGRGTTFTVRLLTAPEGAT